MSILDTNSGRIQANWSVEDKGVVPSGRFVIVAPPDNAPAGFTVNLGAFAYRPHAELAARAPLMAQAMDEFCNRVEAGKVRSRRTYAKFCEILQREPKQ